MKTSPETIREQIKAKLPELELIQNEAYKKAVLDIWTEVFMESDWDSIEDVPKSGDAKEFRNLDHTRSVTLQAAACADVVEKIYNFKVDRDALITAALLHDVSKFFEYNKDGSKTKYGKLMQHGVTTAQKAEQHGLPLEIQHMIITHTGLSKIMPQSIEALILHYVDYLDSDLLLHVLGKPLFLKK